jgi:hypothetical protein
MRRMEKTGARQEQRLGSIIERIELADARHRVGRPQRRALPAS